MNSYSSTDLRYPHRARLWLVVMGLVAALLGLAVTVTYEWVRANRHPVAGVERSDTIDRVFGESIEQTSIQNAASDPESSTPTFRVLRYSESRLRLGPGHNFPIEWVYQQSGVPLAVLRRHLQWYYVRDFDGTEGWLHERLLRSGSAALTRYSRVPLMTYPKHNLADAGSYALLDRGVVLEIDRCLGDFCDASVRAIDGRWIQGWIERRFLWGSLPPSSVDGNE